MLRQLLKLRQRTLEVHFHHSGEPSSHQANAIVSMALAEPDTFANGHLWLANYVHFSALENCAGAGPGAVSMDSERTRPKPLLHKVKVVPKKVLIVDDSPSEVKLIQGLLEPEGYWPVGLSDPKRVEEAIVAERPSVILLDVVMPERNGFQVCRELKGHTEFNSIPVILVTSKVTPSDRYWGEQQGADGYVTKPFTREELLRAVRRFA